jgi:hypothetical protein
MSRAAARRRKSSRIAVSGAVALGLVGPWADTASAADRDGGGNHNQYELSVEADGVNVTVYNQTFPLTDAIGASPFSAIATLDSQGGSTATAAAPYFGAFLQPLFSTVNGVGPGLVPPFPRVPGYVISSYPTTPSAKQTNSSYSIAADSAQDRSTGAVRLGVVQAGTDGNVHALARTIANANGSVTAAGESGVEFLNIGGVLSIGKVLSSLSMTEPGSKAPKITSNTLVSALAVNGIPIGINEKGITVYGTDSSLPADQLNASVKDALAAAGISLTYLPSTQTIDPVTNFVQTVESGALRVTVAQEVPGQGEYKIDMIFGRVVASVINTETDYAVGSAGLVSSSSTAAGSADSVSTAYAPSTSVDSISAASTVGSGPGAAAVGSGAIPRPTGLGAPAAAAPPTVGLELAAAPRDQVRLLGAEISGTASDDAARGVSLTLALCALAALGLAAVAWVLGARGGA